MLKKNVLILGGIVMDRYLLVDDFPKRGQDVSIKESFDKVGGCAINTGKTLKNLGIEPYIVSSIGTDEVGKKIDKYLSEKDFKKECIKKLENEKSGYCLTLVEDKGERTFLYYSGCEDYYYEDMISESLSKNISYIYLTGYYLLDESFSLKILEKIKDLKSYGAKLLFDPGSLVRDIKEDTLFEILKISDYLVPNQSEVKYIEEKLNIKDFATWCLKNGATWVIIKNGAKGLTAYDHKNTYSHSSYKVKAIDTTGAGDSFAGGLIYSLINNFSYAKSLDIASASGAISTTFLGPHGDFEFKDIESIIAKEKGTTLC